MFTLLNFHPLDGSAYLVREPTLREMTIMCKTEVDAGSVYSMKAAFALAIAGLIIDKQDALEGDCSNAASDRKNLNVANENSRADTLADTLDVHLDCAKRVLGI
jgi:hypothetical protein